ncbi:MAG: universal stress protein [Rhodocyclales bacterium]|nr:universal stress protein [Rhodocyclales bacterium]
MKPPRILLLGHHGTPGAARAEALAFEVALPGVTTVVHALVVPDFWDGMQGDDWLNNASTRDDFARHLEGQIAAETRQQIEVLKARCAARGLGYQSLVAFGDPAEKLLAMAQESGAELVVIGPPRAKGEPGYRSRMKLETLAQGLACPLLIAR